METLAQIYKRHSGPGKFNDRGTSHSYIDAYEILFASYRKTAKRVVEIGVYDGHGLRMISDFFSGAEVHGIDCTDQPHGGMADLRPMIAEGKHNIHIFDASNEEAVNAAFGDSKFDVVIDDAGHHIEQQMTLADVWLKRLSPGGIYITEDVQHIDVTRHLFEKRGFMVVDRRPIKNRYDDVLAVWRAPA